MPVTGRSTFQFFWQDRRIHNDYRAGVSLHSHTRHSEESLDIIPRYMTRVPLLCNVLRRQSDHFDFERAFWTPPLTPRQAYRLEEKQINRQFQLAGLISLTDHDNIRAGSLLRVLDRFRKAPVSTEWTVPFGPTFFHLGLHNLPALEAPKLMRDLAQFTWQPELNTLPDLLETLNSYPDLLVVLNHPLWDEKGIGTENHAWALRQLLERHASRIHALELNGLRSWDENKEVIAIARQIGVPVVSGGDRHGREPNAILNVTHACTFVEFVYEVRYERISHMVFMPQYQEPLKLRILQTVIDVLRDYPENPEGRKSWSDRVFYRLSASDAPLPISALRHRHSTVWRLGRIGLHAWPIFSKLLKTAIVPLLSSPLHEWGGAGWKED